MTKKEKIKKIISDEAKRIVEIGTKNLKDLRYEYNSLAIILDPKFPVILENLLFILDSHFEYRGDILYIDVENRDYLSIQLYDENIIEVQSDEIEFLQPLGNTNRIGEILEELKTISEIIEEEKKQLKAKIKQLKNRRQ